VVLGEEGSLALDAGEVHLVDAASGR
jgi:hypothetical protein